MAGMLSEGTSIKDLPPNRHHKGPSDPMAFQEMGLVEQDEDGGRMITKDIPGGWHPY